MNESKAVYVITQTGDSYFGTFIRLPGSVFNSEGRIIPGANLAKVVSLRHRSSTSLSNPVSGNAMFTFASQRTEVLGMWSEEDWRATVLTKIDPDRDGLVGLWALNCFNDNRILSGAIPDTMLLDGLVYLNWVKENYNIVKDLVNRDLMVDAMLPIIHISPLLTNGVSYPN